MVTVNANRPRLGPISAIRLASEAASKRFVASEVDLSKTPAPTAAFARHRLVMGISLEAAAARLAPPKPSCAGLAAAPIRELPYGNRRGIERSGGGNHRLGSRREVRR